MSQAVKCHLFLYDDDLCLVFQQKDINRIEKQLNADFSNICDWFADNNRSIHFGENKTKQNQYSLLLNLKRKKRKGLK